MPVQEDLVELEIAAFMGPHIKRARIALVLVGIVYLYSTYSSYDAVKAAHDMVRGDSSRVASAVNMAYYLVVATGIAGVANIILAAIGGTKTTFAIHVAMAIFAAHSLFMLYLGAIVLTSWIWWLTAIALGMGFQAAWKADQLRKNRRLSMNL